MSDYDFTGAFIAGGIVCALIGAAVVSIIWWLCSHLSIVVRWV